MKAIFLDRDGTLIIDKHYLSSPEQVEYLPGTKEALEIFKDKGFELFLVTNQSGVGRGFFTHEDVHKVHEKIQKDLTLWGTPFKDIIYCPHTPEDNCNCRKPKPGMLNTLIEKWGIDRKESYMIGDKESDVLAGENAKIKGILITSEKNLLNFSNSLP